MTQNNEKNKKNIISNPEAESHAIGRFTRTRPSFRFSYHINAIGQPVQKKLVTIPVRYSNEERMLVPNGYLSSVSLFVIFSLLLSKCRWGYIAVDVIHKYQMPLDSTFPSEVRIFNQNHLLKFMPCRTPDMIHIKLLEADKLCFFLNAYMERYNQSTLVNQGNFYSLTISRQKTLELLNCYYAKYGKSFYIDFSASDVEDKGFIRQENKNL